ncbi:MAG: hypothetical protein R3C42_08650 [Parvularculaceae bacterium]
MKKDEIAEFVSAATGMRLVEAAHDAPENYDWFVTPAPVRPGCMLP